MQGLQGLNFWYLRGMSEPHRSISGTQVGACSGVRCLAFAQLLSAPAVGHDGSIQDQPRCAWHAGWPQSVARDFASRVRHAEGVRMALSDRSQIEALCRKCQMSCGADHRKLTETAAFAKTCLRLGAGVVTARWSPCASGLHSNFSRVGDLEGGLDFQTFAALGFGFGP